MQLGRPPPAAAGEQTLVCVLIAGQICGIPVATVRDVLGEAAVTRIPLAPHAVVGSLNLRGRIVTAIDLRRRLDLPPAPAETQAMAIVVEQQAELYALLVDCATETLTLPAHTPDPATLGLPWRDFSDGIHPLENRLIVVLDIARLLAVPPLRSAGTGKPR